MQSRVSPLTGAFTDSPRIHWCIVGGESGPGARPLHPDWVRSLRDQCQAAGVPFFFKQWGEYLPISEMKESDWQPYYVPRRIAKPGESQDAIDDIEGRRCTVENFTLRFDGVQNPLDFTDINGHHAYLTFRVGKKAAGRLLDGREWSEFPAVEAAR